MKLSTVKKTGLQIKSQRTHIRHGGSGSSASQGVHDDQKRNTPIISNSNSKNKISRLQTNQSKNDTTRRYLDSSPRMKTQGVSSQIAKSSQKLSNNRSDSLTKRMKTDLTDRTQSPALVQQRFNEDHHNTASLAQLLQFHTGYHEIDQQQFNFRVERQAQKSKMEQKYSESQKSEKSSRVAVIESRQKSKEDDENDNQNQNQNDQDQQQQEQKYATEQKSYKISKQSKDSIGQISQNIKKSKKSILSNALSDDKNQQIYTLGTMVQQQSNKKQHQQRNFKKKPKIRSYSHLQKLKIIGDSKYVPKNQQEASMEKRYRQGQIKTLNQIRQDQQMALMFNQYLVNKKKFLQELSRKNEVAKMMSTIKTIKTSNIYNQKVKRAISLPKIKPFCQQFVLPEPQTFVSTKGQQDMQLQKVNQNCANLQGSLSGNKYHYMMKKQTLLRKMKLNEEGNTQIQNIVHIENVLKSKGIGYDANAVRKGLTTTLKTMPDLDLNNRFELPRSLISNPKYQKFPL